MRPRFPTPAGRGVLAPRTLDEAETWLATYEELNTDLHRQLRRLLGLFALAQFLRLPNEVIATLAKTDTPIFRRDISRRWWLILRESRCAPQWERFRTVAETQGAYRAYRWLRAHPRVGRVKRQLLLRRAGVTPIYKHVGHQAGGKCWYKGGTWRLDSVWMRLLRTGEQLKRAPRHRPWQYKIDDRQCRLLEREIHHTFAPQLDTLTVPEMKWGIAEYVRQRIHELLHREGVASKGRGRRGAVRGTNHGVTAWFLGVPVPKNDRYVYSPSRFQAELAKEEIVRWWR